MATPLLLSHLTAAAAPGTMILAGGGTEGDFGDKTAWSYQLYGKLVANGDINGDGKVTVAVLADSHQSQWIPSYFRWLGADEAYNVLVPDTQAANNAHLVAQVANADVVFIKGGDQGEYYDRWKGTALESAILAVAQAGGAIGGTSAGAMSLAQYCFCGSQDLVSLDVLQDAETIYLTDASDGGSGIHTDYLGLVNHAVVDTHFTTRARLGRLLGILAKATQDNQRDDILGIGIDERTGLWIHGSTAEVIGVGAVDFVQQTPTTQRYRAAGEPLVYTDIKDDRLVAGWRYDLSRHAVDLSHIPATAVALPSVGDGAANQGAVAISGAHPLQRQHFAWAPPATVRGYQLPAGTATPTVLDAIGLLNAEDEHDKGAVQETAWRALFDHPAASAFVVPAGTQLSRTEITPDVMIFSADASASAPPTAGIVIDGRSASYADLAAAPSNVDSGDGSLHAAALIGATLHVLSSGSGHADGYDTRHHLPLASTALTIDSAKPGSRY